MWCHWLQFRWDSNKSAVAYPFLLFSELLLTVNAIHLNACKKDECSKASVCLKYASWEAKNNNYEKVWKFLKFGWWFEDE